MTPTSTMSYQEGAGRQFDQQRTFGGGVTYYPGEYYLEKAREIDIPAIIGRATQLYVEIGPSISPNIYTRTYRDGPVYLGVQHGSHEPGNPAFWSITVPQAARIVVANRKRILQPGRGKVGEDIYFMLGDGRDLPQLPDGSAHEVYMSNVVGNGMLPETISQLLHSAARLAGTTGTIAIRETITPYPLEQLITERFFSAGLEQMVRSEHTGGYTVWARVATS